MLSSLISEFLREDSFSEHRVNQRRSGREWVRVDNLLLAARNLLIFAPCAATDSFLSHKDFMEGVIEMRIH